MKKTLFIVALITTGLSAQAQTLVLSDSFDTGGVETNDLNYNLIARQGGTSATNGITASASNVASLLTADGKLNVIGVTAQLDGLVTDSFGSEVGVESFSIKLKAQHDIAAVEWSMISVVSDINANWDISPMTVNLWPHEYIHLDYGDITSNSTNNRQVNMAPAVINAAIGGVYDAAALHEFEIRTVSKTATSGTWGFYMDGITLAAGLPYTFEDAAKKMSWWSHPGTDCNWDDLDISTIPTAPAEEYVFFDNFDAPDGDDMNWLYGNRQTNSTVVAPYRFNPNLFSITNIASNGKLNNYWPEAFAGADLDLATYIVGQDFEFGCKVAVNIPGSEWSSIYLCDENGQDLGNSRFGMYIPGASTPWACVVYHGTGATREIYTIDPNSFSALIPYDKTAEHEFRFVSTAGSGGTNTFELFIDGVEIFDGVSGGLPNEATYYFDGDTRYIGIVGVMPDTADKTNGALYDDVYLKVLKGITYEDWVLDDTDLTVGVNDARSADPEFDGMDNLAEYALGGDPLFNDAESILPVLQFPDAATMEYIYRRRNDALARGLIYDLKGRGNLVVDPWISMGDETGTNAINANIDVVTNSIDITGTSQWFLNLEITEN